jgi:hypothetical protein
MGKNKYQYAEYIYTKYNYFDRHNTKNHNASVIVFHFVMLRVSMLRVV